MDHHNHLADSEQNVRIFRAPSMQEALSKVRRDMGPDAIILQTRQIEKKPLMPWQKATVETEITAASGIEIPDLRERQAEFAARKELEALSAKSPVHPTTIKTPYSTTRDNQLRKSKNGIERSTKEPEQPLPHYLAATLAKELDEVRISHARHKVATPSIPQSESVNIKSASAASLSHQTIVTPQAEDVVPRVKPAEIISKVVLPDQRSDSTEELEQRLQGVERLLSQLTVQMKSRLAEAVSDEMHPLYTHLLDVDVAEPLARELCLELKRAIPPELRMQRRSLYEQMSGLIQSKIRCTGPMELDGQRQKVVALVGPTGVGKTTTIAKLAANYRLQEGVQMGLITIDTYRIAAVEQLKTYAEIIDLPMKVVTSPKELKQAIDEMSHLDFVMIDTAGRSPKDDLKIHELKTLLNEAYVDEIHLVLSATASMKSLETIIERFSIVTITSLIMTKIDEAVGSGVLLSLQQRFPYPFSYLTTGQDVPEDIEIADAATIARSIIPDVIDQHAHTLPYSNTETTHHLSPQARAA